MMQDVHKFIKRHCLFDRTDVVIVAISGGPDSVALLSYLLKMHETFGIKVEAAHANHQLRGQEANDDETYVRQLCNEHGVHLHHTRLNVKEYAKNHQLNTQSAASQLRYNWFDQLLKESEGRAVVATGHHGDDQTETILMTLVRGVTPLTETGIQAKRTLQHGDIVRPFLGITKAQIEHYCNKESLSPRHDSSNESMKYTRNRFRQHVMPFVKEENPVIHEHMQRYQEWQRDDQKFLEELAREALDTIITRKSEQSLTISIEATERLRFPLQRRVIHLILRYLYGKNSPSSTSIHIEQILQMLKRHEPSKELHLANGLFVYLSYDSCSFSTEPRKDDQQGRVLLPTQGKIEVMKGTFTSRYVAIEDMPREQKHMIFLDADKLKLPLSVRGVIAGDRILGRGMTGSKKVSRLFVDRKVRSSERGTWPVLVDQCGKVLWVPFLHRSRIASVNEQTRRVLVLVFAPNDEFFLFYDYKSITGGAF
ncbi:tRNA lysidine(34) synthetase TilS [Bacillus sp. FJAT-45037]|uniref:tRNA lysidine(34) synthetase TilS n=1 Tax=Bacillus sp. FJAT-45037 TaxID=2011007 RepID=UPI000C230C63|nr:tRNA lysidine(34) synthetase TilS [Bacillus sp. FJAT-45037]